MARERPEDGAEGELRTRYRDAGGGFSGESSLLNAHESRLSRVFREREASSLFS